MVDFPPKVLDFNKTETVDYKVPLKTTEKLEIARFLTGQNLQFATTDDIAADFFNGLWEQLRPGLATAQGTPPTLFITYECVGSCGRLGSTKISVLDAYVKPTSRSFVAAGTGVKIELGEIKVVDLSKKIARCADDPAKIRLHHWFSFRIPFKITLTITGGSELSYSTFFLREAVACTYCCELEGGHYSGGQDG